MVYTRKAGPIPLSPGIFASIASQANPSPVPVSNHGMVELRTPRFASSTLPVVTTSTGENPVGGDWCPVNSTSAVAGWFKYYVETPGTTSVVTLRALTFVTVEFRFRS
jgi:hypothetical protein